MRDDILQLVTIEDIKHPDLLLVAETCGLSVALSLYKNLMGVGISIPKNALREFQESFIIENENRYRAKDLAIMLNMHERSVSQVLTANKKNKKKEKADRVQKEPDITLF